MADSEIPTKQLARGFGVGFVVVFAVVFVIALIAGADPLPVFLAALFVGLVVGGGIGFLVAARRATASER